MWRGLDCGGEHVSVVVMIGDVVLPLLDDVLEVKLLLQFSYKTGTQHMRRFLKYVD